MLASRKSSKKRADSLKKIQPTWWVLVVAGFLLLLIRLFYDETWENATVVESAELTLRYVLMLAALLIPLGVYHALLRPRWLEIIHPNPDPVSLILSGLAGLAVWPIAWWAMSLTYDEFLVDLLGNYCAPIIYNPAFQEDVWGIMVIAETVLLPLALMLFFWGLLRAEWQGRAPWLAALLVGLGFGLISVLVFGQGIIGLLGYGLCGAVALLVSIWTRTAWAGFVTNATFIYANQSLLFDLLTEAGSDYFHQTWLTYVLLAGLALIVVLQVLRLRSDVDAQESQISPRFSIWLGLAILMLIVWAVIFTYNTSDEFQECIPRSSQTISPTVSALEVKS